MNTIAWQDLHVAMVVRSFSTKGGLELYAHKVIEGLLNRGLKVTVICEESSTTIKHEALSIVPFPPPPSGQSKSQRLNYYLQVTNQKIREYGPFTLIHSQHLPVEHADIVNFHNQTTEQLNRVGLPWERALNRVKQALIPAYRLRAKYDEMLYQNARCSIFSSAILKEDYQSTYARHGKSAPAVVAYPGATLADSDSSAPPRMQDPQLSFLFVGRGYRKKGLDVLLQACRLLVGQGRKFQLLIAGLRAKPLDRLRLKIMGLSTIVSYLGWENNMASVYARTSAFVMPSRLEPFGMAALQAMQWGLIPIVSRVSGVSEIIEHERNGFILEDHLSSKELAALMAQVMDNSTVDLSKQAQQTAQFYTWDKTVESTLKAYRLALPALSPPQSKVTTTIESAD